MRRAHEVGQAPARSPRSSDAVTSIIFFLPRQRHTPTARRCRRASTDPPRAACFSRRRSPYRQSARGPPAEIYADPLPTPGWRGAARRSEEHTSELQSRLHLVCRLLLEKKKKKKTQQLQRQH